MEKSEAYMRAYMDGYTHALEQLRKEQKSPVIDKEGIQKRYGVGMNKAGEILRSVRHCCNGGKLGSSSIVLLSELEYWESVVDKTYLARL